MNSLATCKMLTASLLLISPLCRAEENQIVDGPFVRTIKQADGSKSIFSRSPDNKTLTKKTYSANGPLTMLTVYKMDANGNPLGCKIRDGQNEELFKVAYGYSKITGQLVEELMFDSRVKRINKDTGKEQEVQRLAYIYDAEGKRSAPIIFNYLPGKTFEQVFGIKSSALDVNPFKEGKR
jgi:hypothetical protein